LTAWNTAKRSNAGLRQRIAEARDDWARLRHAQHAAAVYPIQSTRAANRKALKPQPTRQAKLVAWHLTFRVPLNFAAIPESDIKQACERFGMSLDTWQRQEHTFGLLKKVYAKRAKLRGEQHSFNRRDGRRSFLALCERLCWFVDGEATKHALVEAGADSSSTYTRNELRILVVQNRAKPFLPDELCKLHEIKGRFTEGSPHEQRSQCTIWTARACYAKRF
jgi:hypothetical protein